MFERFAENRLRYEKGQIFPFAVALIVIMLIFAMLTVNIGQISMFKTDTSNAADAAALAGASVLSGTLLGFGLKSDMMAGFMVVSVVAIIIDLVRVIGAPAAIATYIAYFISELTDYFQALWDGQMAWSNAKKTAISYAYQNAGVDEPRPTFKEFVQNAYHINDLNSLPPPVIDQYYQEYIRGETGNARRFSRSGFSQFMDHQKTGYWHFGEIAPGKMSDALITSGYGWTQNNDATFATSYNPDTHTHNDYHNYDNFVEVRVIGAMMYPLAIYDPSHALVDALSDKIEDMFNLDSLPRWLRWLGRAVIKGLLLGIAGAIFKFLPAGLTFTDGMEKPIDNNPLQVTVTHYKKEHNLGIWKFRYGKKPEGPALGGIWSQAQSHAFREHAGDSVLEETIEPTFFASLGDLIEAVFGGEDASDWRWFNTERHLFETELQGVK